MTRRASFGRTQQGAEVDLFTLANRHGLEVEITNYGGIVVALRVPDRRGLLSDVVLGFETLDGYLGAHPYFGAIIGRFGNRIARGRFHLDGREYVLAVNDGANHLHGGMRGFDRAVWDADPRPTEAGSSLALRYRSLDGEEGYPGNLDCEVMYSLTDADEFRIDYRATSDRPTIVNLTHHSYFNLTGDPSGNVLDHELLVDADLFTPVDETLIPTGELLPVADTAFDFRGARQIGARITAPDPQLALGRGYDHNFVLNRAPRHDSIGPARLAARLLDRGSGRVMEVFTTEPGLQVYAGGGLSGDVRGKGGQAYGRNAGLCLETQHFPDSPNHPAFPTVRLAPERNVPQHNHLSILVGLMKPHGRMMAEPAKEIIRVLRNSIAHSTFLSGRVPSASHELRIGSKTRR